MNIQTKTFSYRLKPTKEQSRHFVCYAGCARFVYNFGLSQIKNAFEAKEKIPNYTDLANMLPLLKKNSVTSWLKDPHSQILQQSLKDLESGMKHFFRRLKNKEKPGFPKFKKKGMKDSFRYPQGFKFEPGMVFLPKIGWVRYYDSRSLEGIAVQTTIKREANFWYMRVVCEIERDVVKVPVSIETALGIDLGLTNFAYLSNDQVIENPKFLRNDLKKLRAYQRRLSRKKKGSNNRKKCAIRVVKIHVRIKNKRKDFHHKLSTQIAKNHGVVAVENLNVKGMVQNRHLAQAISDAGWSNFLNQLEYKCDWLGKHFVQVDRFFASSKTCSSCGAKQGIMLGMRIFKCVACELILDRDFNASLNIRTAGLSVLKACGEIGIGQLDETRIAGF
jgi:putative transposase